MKINAAVLCNLEPCRVKPLVPVRKRLKKRWSAMECYRGHFHCGSLQSDKASLEVFTNFSCCLRCEPGERPMTENVSLDLAELDRERHEQDRAIGRGYDYDATAPSHAEFLKRQGREPDDDLWTRQGR